MSKEQAASLLTQLRERSEGASLMSMAAARLLDSGEYLSAEVMLEKLEIRLAHLNSLRGDLLAVLQGVRRMNA